MKPKKKIDVVIVEGFESSRGLNPPGISHQILEGKTDTFYPGGESSFAVEMAESKNIPYRGGEPSDKKIYDDLVQKGYRAHDIVGFYFVRRIPQEQRSQKVNDLRALAKIFISYSQEKVKNLELADFSFSFVEFKEWYRSKQGRELSLESGGRGETAPVDGPYFTQKMSRIITTIRDQHILSTIEEKLNTYDHVLIVYGSSHYRIQHRALKKALGAPKEITPEDLQ